MNKKIFISLLSASLVLSAAQAAYAKDAVITDQDLEKYKKGGSVIDNQTVQKKEPAAPKKFKDRDRQRWCDEGDKYRKQIVKAQEDIKQADKALEEQKSVFPVVNKKIKAAQAKKLKAEKALKESEAKLDALENRAHRSSIPPGWVRCQYE